MKRIFCLSAAALLGWAASANAGLFCGHCCGDHCKPMPPTPPCDCGDPCAEGHHRCPAWKSRHAHKLLDDLCAEDCCTRIRAAKKLAHRCHGDFCCDCDILPALVKALLADPCWKVRRHAAWAIAMQGARTEFALVALYVSSKTDAHYMVRDRATDAIDQLILCRRECYKKLFLATDGLVRVLQSQKVRPGRDKADLIVNWLHEAEAAVAPTTLPPQKTEKPQPQPNQNEKTERLPRTQPEDENNQNNRR
jgi:hypothetical protein